MDKFVLYIPESIQFSDEQLLALCERNSDLRIETDVDQNLIIMSPTGFNTGKLNFKIAGEFAIWNKTAQLGEFFDSSTGFRFANGSMKAPDVSFVSNAQQEQLSEADKQGFAQIPPEFVLELRSPSDSKKEVIAKMEMYMQNGCKLGWLIDPLDQDYMIFRPNTPNETFNLSTETKIDGENILPGFILKWNEIDN